MKTTEQMHNKAVRQTERRWTIRPTDELRLRPDAPHRTETKPHSPKRSFQRCLDGLCFEPFRPVFEFIKSKCGTAANGGQLP